MTSTTRSLRPLPTETWIVWASSALAARWLPRERSPRHLGRPGWGLKVSPRVKQSIDRFADYAHGLSAKRRSNGTVVELLNFGALTTFMRVNAATDEDGRSVAQLGAGDWLALSEAAHVIKGGKRELVCVGSSCRGGATRGRCRGD